MFSDFLPKAECFKLTSREKYECQRRTLIKIRLRIYYCVSHTLLVINSRNNLARIEIDAKR